MIAKYLGRRSFKKYTLSRKHRDERSDGAGASKTKIDDTKQSNAAVPLDTKSTTIKEEVQTNTLMLNKERCKKKVGYLVKSPSKICFKNKIARWHLRWFVLYDNKQLYEEGESEERIVELIYYKNHQEEQKHSQPLGRIDLRGAKVIPHKGGLHGYHYAINVVTPLRCIHLCATQSVVYEEWLQKLRMFIDETTTPIETELTFVEIDEGYNTWGKSQQPPPSPSFRELTKKDFRNQKKHGKTYIQKQEYSNIDSPSQITTPFKSASSFFEPDTDTLDVPPPPLIRRPRSNTTQPIDSTYSDDGDSQWEISAFTGPTTCFVSSKTLLRQKSSSTSALFTSSLNTNSSTTLPRNVKHRIPDTLNELSPSMISQQRQPIRQRNSVGPTSHWRIN